MQIPDKLEEPFKYSWKLVIIMLIISKIATTIYPNEIVEPIVFLTVPISIISILVNNVNIKNNISKNIKNLITFLGLSETFLFIIISE